MINDTNISKLSNNKLSDFRNQHIGFVFQFHQLLPEFTALENIMIPAFIGGVSKSVAKQKAEELLEFMQLRIELTTSPMSFREAKSNELRWQEH